jgi:hypothetical protein
MNSKPKLRNFRQIKSVLPVPRRYKTKNSKSSFPKGTETSPKYPLSTAKRWKPTSYVKSIKTSNMKSMNRTSSK